MGRSSALEHGHPPGRTQDGLFLQQHGISLGMNIRYQVPHQTIAIWRLWVARAVYKGTRSG